MILADWILRPEALPLLLLAPLAWIALRWLDGINAARLLRLAGARAPALAAETSPKRRSLRRVLFAAGLLLGLAATLHPVYGAGLESEQGWRGVDVVVCLDVSRSMLARDVLPDRLSRAREEVRSLAARARGDRLGLVVFAGVARASVPLTEDLASFATLADQADPSSVERGGSDVGAALEAALALLEGRTGEHAAIVLVTDGEDLGGRGLVVAQRAKDRGIAVHALGLGTALGSKIALDGSGSEAGGAFLRDGSGREVITTMDAEGLRRIAAATGGSFVDGAWEPHALVDLYNQRILPMARETFEAEGRGRRENRYQWFLLASLVFLLFDLGLTDRRKV